MLGMKCKREWSNITFNDVDLYIDKELAKLLCTFKVMMKVYQTCKFGVHICKVMMCQTWKVLIDNWKCKQYRK
jgi:hypothetical protein